MIVCLKVAAQQEALSARTADLELERSKTRELAAALQVRAEELSLVTNVGNLA